jgi:CHASE2 domain-containing sensor protein
MGPTESQTTVKGHGAARLPKFALLLVLASACGFAALAFPSFRARLVAVEYWTSDWRTALLSDRAGKPHERVAVVLFDPDSAPGRSYLPVPRDYHASVIRALDAAGPAVIGLDFYFLQPTDPDSDRTFIDTIRNAKAQIVVGAVDEGLKQFNAKQFAYQRRFLDEVGRPAGNIALNFDGDKVTRRTYDASRDAQFQETFSRRIARLAGAQVADVPQETRIGWLWGPQSDPYPFVTMTAQDLLAEQPGSQALRDRLEGRIVLIGLNFPYFDRHNTPLSVITAEGMLGVMIHGQMIAQLLDRRIYSELAPSHMVRFLAGVLLAGLVLSWIFWKHASLLGQGIAAAVLVLADAVLFYGWRIYLPLTPALYVWFLAVMAGSNLRSLGNWAIRRLRASRRKPAPEAA